MTNQNRRLLNIGELSLLLGRSENSLRYHIRMGRIKPTAKFGRCYSFDPDDVLKQLQKNLPRDR